MRFGVTLSAFAFSAAAIAQPGLRSCVVNGEEYRMSPGAQVPQQVLFYRGNHCGARVYELINTVGLAISRPSTYKALVDAQGRCYPVDSVPMGGGRFAPSPNIALWVTEQITPDTDPKFAFERYNKVLIASGQAPVQKFAVAKSPEAYAQLMMPGQRCQAPQTADSSSRPARVPLESQASAAQATGV